MSVGVIPMRVQVHELHEGHMHLIDTAYEQHDRVIIALGVSPVKGDADDPLDYETRKHMVQLFAPDAIIVPLPNHECDYQWSEYLDQLIKMIAPFQDATLYCGRNGFKPHYQGKWHVEEIDTIQCASGTQMRQQIGNGVHVGDTPDADKDFRKGVIYALENQYPKVVPVVDVAVVRRIKGTSGGWETLMFQRAWGGRKFIGGFVDMKDSCYDEAALREFYEECHYILNPHNIKHTFSLPIDDWRYRGRRKSKLMSTVFVVEDDTLDIERLSFTEGWVKVEWVVLERGWQSFHIDPAHEDIFEMVRMWVNKQEDMNPKHSND